MAKVEKYPLLDCLEWIAEVTLQTISEVKEDIVNDKLSAVQWAGTWWVTKEEGERYLDVVLERNSN